MLRKLSLFFFGLSFALTAQIVTPKYSNEFLRLGVGARAAGMANAVVSNTKNVNAGYWNPASLAFAPEYTQFALMHAEYFAGILKYDYAAFATPLKNIDKEIGVSFIRLGIDNIPNTLNIKEGGRYYFDRITSFSAADMALLLSYASPIMKSDKLAYGINFKIINRKVGNFANAWGFGMDAGITYCTPKMQFSAVLRDGTGTFNAWSFNTETFEDIFRQTGNEIPQNSIELTLPSASFGATRFLLPEDKKIQALLALDADVFFDGARNTLFQLGGVSFAPKIATEISYKKTAYLRLGAYRFQQDINPFTGKEFLSASPTAGFGVKIKSLNIDYAVINNNALQKNMYSHLVSIILTLEKPVE